MPSRSAAAAAPPPPPPPPPSEPCQGSRSARTPQVIPVFGFKRARAARCGWPSVSSAPSDRSIYSQDLKTEALTLIQTKRKYVSAILPFKGEKSFFKKKCVTPSRFLINFLIFSLAHNLDLYDPPFLPIRLFNGNVSISSQIDFCRICDALLFIPFFFFF